MPIRFDKLTRKAQQALQDAQEQAARRSHQELTGLHLLAALLAQSDGIVLPLLAKLGARPERIAAEVERALQRLLQDPLAQRILQGEILPGDTVTVDADSVSAEIRFERAVNAVPA